MNRSKNSFSPPTVGASSLLVVFGIVCLTVFSLLSLSTVQAHERLAERSRDAVKCYYEADCEAERILAEIRSGEKPECAVIDGERVKFAVCISETQNLLVEADINENEYTVRRWQAVSATEWQPDDTIKVWSGHME